MIKLSILIPTYNYKFGLLKILEGFIKCRENDLNQIELIIGDDSSTKIIENFEIDFYKKYIPNFRYIKNKNNLYIKNWNNLISKAKGKYYWLLHHDEEILNPREALEKILNNFENYNNQVFILPVIKFRSINFLNLRIYTLIKHNSPKNLLEFFLKNYSYLMYINIIGPPSGIIVSQKIKSLYRDELKWLVDVDYYIDILSRINYKDIKTLSFKEVSILSDQNYKNSITKLNKTKNKIFKNLKKLEETKIIKKYGFKNKNNILLKCLWVVYKLNCFISMRIKINSFSSK